MVHMGPHESLLSSGWGCRSDSHARRKVRGARCEARALDGFRAKLLNACNHKARMQSKAHVDLVKTFELDLALAAVSLVLLQVHAYNGDSVDELIAALSTASPVLST